MSIPMHSPIATGSTSSRTSGRVEPNRKLACQACRASRLPQIRCLPSQPHSALKDPCKRCLRLEQPCLYVDKRRSGATRKRNWDRQGRSLSPEQRTRIETTMPAPPIPTVVKDSRYPFQTLSPGHRISPELETPSNGQNFVVPPTDLASVLRNLESPRSFKNRETLVDQVDVTNSLVLDPVSLGVLEANEATYLFNRFLTHYNTYIAILDPQLHTELFTKTTSLVLYLSILAVSSKIDMPIKYQPLMRLTNTVLSQAFATASTEIGLVQALSILSTWREPEDKSAYIRIGYAIRIACEIGLHNQPARPLPLDLHQARLRLNGERTWIQLVTFDRTLHHLYNRRRMCTPQDLWDTNKWVVDHPSVFCYTDSMLAASQAFGSCLHIMRLYEASKHHHHEANQTRNRLLVHQLKTKARVWEDRWFNNPPPVPLSSECERILRYYQVALSYCISEFETLSVGRQGSDDIQSFSDTVAKGMDVIRYLVKELAPIGALNIAPDLVTLQAARIGVFLAKNAVKIDPQGKQEITQLFSSLITLFSSTSNGTDTGLYQVKFFSTLLRLDNWSEDRVSGPQKDAAASGPQVVNPVASTSGLQQAEFGQIVQLPINNSQPMFDGNSLESLLHEANDWFNFDMQAYFGNESLFAEQTETTPSWW